MKYVNPSSISQGNKIPWQHKILTRSLILFMAISFLPLLLVGIVTTNYVSKDSRENAEHALIETATDLTSRIERYFDILTRDMRFIAINFDRKNVHSKDNIRFLTAFAVEQPDIRTIWMVDSEGSHDILYSRDEMLSKKVPAIKTPPLSGQAAGNIVWHHTRYDEFGEAIIIASLPILAPWEERAAGTLFFEIRPQDIHKLLEGLTIGREGVALLVDESGHLLSHSDRSIVAAGHDMFSTRPKIKQLISEHLDDSRSHLLRYVGADGKYVLADYAQLPLTKWGVVVERSESEVYSMRNRLIWLIVFGFFGVIMLVIPMAILFSFRLTSPLTRLSDTTKALASGDLSARTNIDSKDEIGTLANTFNRMAELRQKSEALLKAYIDNTGDAIYILEADTGRILNCNSQACIDLGYSKDELSRLSLIDIESKLTLEEINTVHDNLKPGEAITVEGEHKRNDGLIFPVEIRLNLLLSDQSKIIIALARDITERKQTEKKILEYGEFLNVVLNSMSENICILDVVDNSIIDCNKSFLTDYGFEKYQVVGRKCYEVTHNQDHPCNEKGCNCPMQETLKSGKFAIVEHIHQHNNTEYYLEISTSPIRNADGEIIQIIHAAKDITAKKAAEKALMESEKMAAVGRLSTGIAHELNNPLMGIGGYLSFIQDKLNDKDDQELVAKALRETKRCTKIIKDLLVFSRQPSEVLEDIDLGAIARTIAVRHEDEIKNNGISVKLSVEQDGLFVKGNETNMETIFDNMIRNAIDALKESSKKVLEIRVFRSLEDAVIEISDSGIGIPPDIIDKVTEPFFTTKKPLQGTGLGLAMCSNIINNYGGRLCIDSTEGKGTKITVTFPLIKDVALIGG